MPLQYLIAFFTLATFVVEAETTTDSVLPAYTTPVYSSMVNTNRLKPFHAKWIQQKIEAGKTTTLPVTIEEKLIKDEQGNWQHIQVMHDEVKDMKVHHTRTFDQQSMRFMTQKTRYENAPEQAPKSVSYELFNNRFSGEVVSADGALKSIEHPLSMPMFDGQIAGLPIASLPLELGKKWSMPMVIPTMKSEYWLEATVTAKKLMAAENGNELEVWVVDALWHNLTDGDVYPAGPNNSGGTYYINVDQQAGEPVVIAYANQNAVILWDGQKQQQP